MNISEMDINSILPYPHNPRRNDVAVDKVAMSIQEFGWQQPIVVDSDHVVIIGHTRLKAAHKLGMKKVPVHVAHDLKPDAVKLLRIADNKTGEYAEWDMELLIKELEGLRDSGNDLLLTGFEEDEINNMVKDLDKIGAEFDNAEVKTNKVVSKVGDIWELGTHILTCGSMVIAPDTKQMLDNFSHAYGLIICNFSHLEEMENNGAEFINIYKALLHHSSPDISLSQMCVVGNIEDAYIMEALDELKGASFYPYRSYVWIKDKPSYYQGVPSHHVNIIHCGNQLRPLEADRLKINNSVFQVLTSFEPKELPIPLVQQLIRIGDLGEDQIIFDPFGRDASTLLAAETLNKTCHIDVPDPRKCDEMIMRWQVLTGKDAVAPLRDNSTFNEMKGEENAN